MNILSSKKLIVLLFNVTLPVSVAGANSLRERNELLFRVLTFFARPCLK